MEEAPVEEPDRLATRNGEMIARYSRGSMVVATAGFLLFSVGAAWSIPYLPESPGYRGLLYIPYLSEGLMIGVGLYCAWLAVWVGRLLFACSRRGLTAISVSGDALRVSVLKTVQLQLENIRQVTVHKRSTRWSSPHARKLSIHLWDAKPVWMPAILFRTPVAEVVHRLEALGVRVVERDSVDTDLP